MGDLTAGGTIDYSAMPTWTARLHSSSTDIRRTAPPQPTVIGTAQVVSTGFTNANNSIFGDGESRPLNSGVLIRVVDSSTNKLFWGFTADASKCNFMASGDSMFVPTTNLGNILFSTTAGGCTISVLGE